MSGFDYTFVSQVANEYMCLICHCPMRKPVQTKCGHRFCKHCLQQSMKRSQQCPMDREGLDECCATDIYPDVASERTILDFLAKCSNNECDWIGELRSVEAHEDNCLFSRTTCTNENCDVATLWKDLWHHVANECPRRMIECYFCKESYVCCLQQDHFKECSRCPCNCVQECGQSDIPRNEMNDHIETVCPLTEMNCTFAHVGCQVKVQRNDLSQHVQASHESHLSLSCKTLQEQKNKLQELQVKYDATKTEMEELQKKQKDTEAEMEELKAEVVATRQRNVCSDFIWKFTKFEQCLEKAKRGGQERFSSNSFYTGSYGYRMCVSIYPNGNKDGNKTHLSVYVNIQEGDYDNILPWPFNQKVVLALIDQQAYLSQRKDKERSLVPENCTDRSYLFKPSSEQNKSRGWHKFMSHDDLRTRRYLVDDTLFLRVKVERNSN